MLEKSDPENQKLTSENTPKVSAISEFIMLLGTVLHTFIFIGIKISTMLRVQHLTFILLKARIRTDKYSFEPLSCGYSRAQSKLGLALLKRNDVVGAIECLEASWRIHPCPHNTSFGLPRNLARTLMTYPEAEKAVEKYIKMGQAFVTFPEKWLTSVTNPQ